MQLCTYSIHIKQLMIMLATNQYNSSVINGYTHTQVTVYSHTACWLIMKHKAPIYMHSYVVALYAQLIKIMCNLLLHSGWSKNSQIFRRN